MASDRILPSTSSDGTGRPSASTNRKPSAGEPTRSHQSLPRDPAIGDVEGSRTVPAPALPPRPRARAGAPRCPVPPPGRGRGSGAAGFAAAECVRVVGMVADVRFRDVTGPSTAVVYRPIAQRPERMAVSLFIRGDDVRRLAPLVRRELQVLDPAAPAVHVEPLAARLRPQFLPWEVAGKVFGAL